MSDAIRETTAPIAVEPARRRRTGEGRLFRKYVALFVAVVCLALLLNGAFEIWFFYQDHEASLIRIQREQAASAAAKIEQFVAEIQSQIGWTTELPWSGATLDQRRFDALRLLRQVPAITELSQLDPAGREQLRVSRLEMDVVGSGTDYSHDPRFAVAVAHKAWYGPVYFRRESEPYMTLALAGTRRDAGVSVAEVNLKFIWDVVSQIKVGEHGEAYVVDAGGRLIAHPDISLVLRNTSLSRLPQVKAALQGAPQDEAQEARNLAGRRVLTAYAKVEPLGWYVFVELPIAEANAPLYAAIERAGGLLVLCLVLAFFAGLFLARRMVVPIQAMRAGAARIGGGDLGQRLSVKTGDELEALADQFNDMAGRLQESYAGLERKVEDRTRELTEALEQQTATSEVLRVISASPGDLQPIFATMLENALRTCAADEGILLRFDGSAFFLLAALGTNAEFLEIFRNGLRPAAENALGRVVATAATVHIVDLHAEHAGTSDSLRAAGIRSTRARTLIVVPMLKEGELIGAFALNRVAVRSFSDKQITLLENFASQAVIAIENVRLLSELRESLEQQTATAEVLGVISSSPGDLQPVFQAMLENATRLCEATAGTLYLYDGDAYRVATTVGMPVDFVSRRMHGPFRPHPATGLGRATLTRQTVHIADITTIAEFLTSDLPAIAVTESGVRSLLVVPMLREGELIGAMALYRREVRPYTDKQIALVESFAAQAVIAIENARLLTELRESLEQQTATAEVLGVISSSPGALQPVFDAMLDNATRICEAQQGMLLNYDGEQFSAVALQGVPLESAQMGQSFAMPPDSNLGRTVATKMVVHEHDLAASPAYLRGHRPTVNAVEKGSVRTALHVPMLKEGEVIGVICVVRSEVRPFSNNQIELVENFAAQAVIAIENTRLLTELRARTDELARSVEELRALGEVSQAVNSTLDLQTVLTSIVANSVHLSHTDAGAIYVFDEDAGEFGLRATFGMDESLIAAIGAQHIHLGTAGIGEAAARRTPVQLADLRDQPRNPVTDLILAAGFRALLVMPLLRPDRIVGALVVRRRAPGEFAAATVDLLQTFAAQSVVAIQNARLFGEIEEKSRELAVASRHKSQFLANMSHELRTPLNAILGYTELILDDIYGVAPAKMRDALDRVQRNGKHLLGLINDVLDLSKIEAGQLSLQLANFSLKDMLQGVYAAVEPLAAAKRLALRLDVPHGLPQGRGDERRLSQVVLNLVGNAIKFTDAGEVKISAAALNGSFTVAVRDTGPGIAAADQAKIFEEFQQADNSSTRAKGGTGLGLAISRRIVEMHGGRLWVESEPGRGSTFAFTLPVTVDRQRGTA